jgi:uncharacterized protein with HEPN domain
MKEQERNVGIFLHDILDNISRIERFTKGITFEQFRTDEKTYFATIQCIEIIGEAAKHIPALFRSAYHEVPWNDMAGMRDKLIHAYFGTDPFRAPNPNLAPYNFYSPLGKSPLFAFQQP